MSPYKHDQWSPKPLPRRLKAPAVPPIHPFACSYDQNPSAREVLPLQKAFIVSIVPIEQKWTTTQQVIAQVHLLPDEKVWILS